MIILGIETSCDETAIAVVKKDPATARLEILSNIISSQVKIHAKFGGVVPNLAKREHLKNLPRVFKFALKTAKINPAKIDLIAVTNGPGLEPALWTGVNFANELAKKLKKPIIGIDHMEGHTVIGWLKPANGNSKFQMPNAKKLFPLLALLVSGGHTQLILVKKFGQYKIVGETRDDAAGEAFDKVARMLGLGYPGGPVIAKEAEKLLSLHRAGGGTIKKFINRGGAAKAVFQYNIKLPRPMLNSPDYDFSFSGLKTAVLYLVKNLKEKKSDIKKFTPVIAVEFQQAVIDVLIKKTLRAAKEFKVKTVILGGGVAANDELRKQSKFLAPAKNLATDNGVMIAVAASFHPKKDWQKQYNLEAKSNLRLS